MITSKNYISKLAEQNPPAMAYKGDMPLADWQKAAKEKLAELLGLDQMIRCEEDDFTIQKEEVKDGYTQYDFIYQSEPGYYVPCSLLVPAGIEKPLPGVICLQGHSTGMHISLGIAKFPNDSKSIAGGRDFAVRAVKEGFCAIAMEQRYMGQCGPTENGTPACIGSAENAAMGAILMGRTAIGERVWDTSRLIDVIEAHFGAYIDASRIICMGNSGGGTATFYASCMEERIALSMPSCAVCTYDESIMAMNHCPCNFVPGIRRYFNMGDLGCLIAPRPLVVVCGETDPIFPLPGVKKSFAVMQQAYADAGKADLCHLVIGNGGHQFYPDDAWPVAKNYLANL